MLLRETKFAHDDSLFADEMRENQYFRAFIRLALKQKEGKKKEKKNCLCDCMIVMRHDPQNHIASLILYTGFPWSP